MILLTGQLELKIDIEISPRVQKLTELFDGPSRKAMYGLVALELSAQIDKQFDTQGVHFLGHAWKELSAFRREQREKESPNRIITILFDTGALKQTRNTIESEQEGGVHMLMDYASIHEEGGSIFDGFRSVAIPQRKIFPYDYKGKEIVQKTVEAFIEAKTKEF